MRESTGGCLDDVVLRPISGADEIWLFNRLDDTLNDELADAPMAAAFARAGYVTFERAITMTWD